MKSLRWKYRSPFAAVVVAGTAWSSLQANEPITAPPAPVLTAQDEVVLPSLPPLQESGAGAPTRSASLAPAATDAPGTFPSPIVPTARRTERALAPSTIGGEPAYIPGSAGSAMQIYPASTPQVQGAPPANGEVITYGEEVVYGAGGLDEATVRISDRPAEQQMGDVPGVRPSSRICPHCRYAASGLPYWQDSSCEPDPRMVRQYIRRHGVCYPPDYGWSPPANHPIDRISIDYYRAFPAAWNGVQQPGPAIVRPTVYWPTDTTQLGYTYQHSPRWMPYPGMVPPVPHPGEWHVPLYTAQHQAGPCPTCRGNAAVPLAQNAPRSANVPSTNQPGWIPTDVPQSATNVTELPAGPALNSTQGAPLLTPVPF